MEIHKSERSKKSSVPADFISFWKKDKVFFLFLYRGLTGSDLTQLAGFEFSTQTWYGMARQNNIVHSILHKMKQY